MIALSDKWKSRLVMIAIPLAVAWLATLTVGECHRPGAQGFQSGGAIALGGGGGLAKVTNTGGILSGSGTPANPETATLTTQSPIIGTGSSGSALGVAVETNSPGLLAGSGSSGSKLTVTIGTGSGITGTGSSGSTLKTNAGSGLTYSSGALITNAGSGLTYSSGALITNAGSGMTYVAGALQASLGAGLAFSGANIIASNTAATCTNGQGVTSITSSGAGTCGNVGRNAYGGTHFEWSSDWMWLSSAQTINSAINVGDFTLICAGSGAQIQNASGVTARPGILEMTTGAASATGQCRAMSNPTIVNFGDGNWQWQSVVAWGSISTAADEVEDVIGFIDTTTVNQVDGCYFAYDRGNVLTAPSTGAGNTGNKQDLECWCANNSTRTGYVMDGTIVSDSSFTTIAAPVAAVTYPNTNVANLQIIMTGSSEADFYYNGVLSCKITTNIPTGSSRLTGFGFNHIKSANTAAARTLDVDYTNVIVDLTSARSP